LDLPGGLQFAGIPIDLKHDDGIRSLVFRQQPPARRVQSEVARDAAQSGGVLHQRKAAGGRVHGKNCDAIVPPIRPVQKTAIRMQHDFRSAVVRGEILRERGNGLYCGQRRIRCGIAKNADRAGYFIDDINESPITGKG